MPYPSGDKLTKRLEQAGLSGLAELFQDILNGKAIWPGPCEITVEPQFKEGTRNLLYAALHQFNLKNDFEIKSGGLESLIINQKQFKQSKVGVNFFQPAGPGSGPQHRPGDTMDEDLQSIWEVDPD
jgi:hypothetical protein